MVDHAGWRWIFLVNAADRGPRLLLGRPPRGPPGARARRAWTRPARSRSAAALRSLMVGLTFGPLWGWSSGRVMGLIAGGAVLLAAFLVAETRVSAPLIDLDMFRRSRSSRWGTPRRC